MINLSVPDTIDERTINKKKLTPFTIQVHLPCVTLINIVLCLEGMGHHHCQAGPFQMFKHYSSNPGSGLVICHDQWAQGKTFLLHLLLI